MDEAILVLEFKLHTGVLVYLILWMFCLWLSFFCSDVQVWLTVLAGQTFLQFYMSELYFHCLCMIMVAISNGLTKPWYETLKCNFSITLVAAAVGWLECVTVRVRCYDEKKMYFAHVTCTSWRKIKNKKKHKLWDSYTNNLPLLWCIGSHMQGLSYICMLRALFMLKKVCPVGF